MVTDEQRINKAVECLNGGEVLAAYELLHTVMGASEDERRMRAAVETINKQSERIEKLESELETERMRLAACGCIALSNTPESAAEQRKIADEYKSASLDDVIRIVDSEMALRKENAELKAHCESLRSAGVHLLTNHEYNWAAEVFSETPPQSLQEIKAQAIEEFADSQAKEVGAATSDDNAQFFIDCAEQAYEYAENIREG